MVAHACNPSAQEVARERSGIPGRSLLHSEFDGSLGDTRPHPERLQTVTAVI